MAATLRVTVEGQAVELGWIRSGMARVPGGAYREAYEDMVVRKTATYSFLLPAEVGCIGAGAPLQLRARLRDYGRHLGIAFQIADDLLNLRDDTPAYGKERDGDLWEGKRTLMLLHALEVEPDPDLRSAAEAALSRRRPGVDVPSGMADPGVKTEADVRLLRALLERQGSIALASEVASAHAASAARALEDCRGALRSGEPARFLQALPRYVVERLR